MVAANFVTQFGNLAVLGPVAAVAAMFVAWRWGAVAGLRFAWPILAAFVAILLLKYQVSQHGGQRIVPAPLLSYTAPSGHAGLAAAIYGGIGLLAAHEIGGRTGFAVRLAVAVLVIAVAVSRVLLGVHGVGDVATGLGIGTAAGFCAASVRGPRSLRPRMLLAAAATGVSLMLVSGQHFDSSRWL